MLLSLPRAPAHLNRHFLAHGEDTVAMGVHAIQSFNTNMRHERKRCQRQYAHKKARMPAPHFDSPSEFDGRSLPSAIRNV